jgi:hypothetical protein
MGRRTKLSNDMQRAHADFKRNALYEWQSCLPCRRGAHLRHHHHNLRPVLFAHTDRAPIHLAALAYLLTDFPRRHPRPARRAGPFDPGLT